jgi:hypothetical protein
MKLTTRFGALTALALSLGLTPMVAHAQKRQSARWVGRVDSVSDVYFRRGRSWSTTVSGSDKKNRGSARFTAPLPRKNVMVGLEREMGRGVVSVRQQPKASNDYTAIVRIQDRKGAVGRYRFTLNWDN